MWHGWSEHCMCHGGAGAASISLTNTRSDTRRYEDFFCSVQFFVPDRVVLPGHKVCACVCLLAHGLACVTLVAPSRLVAPVCLLQPLLCSSKWESSSISAADSRQPLCTLSGGRRIMDETRSRYQHQEPGRKYDTRQGRYKC